MSRGNIGAALAAAAVIGLGGVLGATTAATPVAAEDLPAVTDFSAQQRAKGGGGGGGGARRAAPAPRRATGGTVQRSTTVRRTPAGGTVRRTTTTVRPGARPAARPAVRAGVVAPRRGAPVRIGGRNVVVVRGPHRWYWRGRYWPLVAVGTLGVVTVGSLAYSAYGYVPVSTEPLCVGQTEDGCILRWTNVPASDNPGILIPQCVQYCPQ